jgi:hypothetical protein
MFFPSGEGEGFDKKYKLFCEKIIPLNKKTKRNILFILTTPVFN